MRRRIVIIGCQLLLVLATAALLSGCASTIPLLVPPKPLRFSPAPATVFVTDGAGNFQVTSKVLRNVLQRDGYPIEVITYEWSHGKHRILKDQLDYAHARCEGKKFAQLLQDYHAAHPERPLYLLGHSAGCTSLMAALEQLPPGVVDRAVLLAPALSADYDVLPALHGVQRGLHVFYSPHDTCYLGVVTRIIGTSDRTHAVTAGRVGFRPVPDPAEPELLQKLYQRRWQSSDRDLGNNGGHYGNYQPDFLRTYVIPLLNP